MARGIPTDITGQRFYRLTAVEPTDQRSARSVVWRCRCDCGNEKLASVNNLLHGSVKSCGCIQREVTDIAGKRFGRLTAIDSTYRREDEALVWRCVCDCGNETFVIGSKLRSGKTLSCGCYHREISVELGKASASDLRGMIFGRLTAVEPTNQRSGACVVWRCICECGNEVYVSSSRLRNGKTKSCGCLQKENSVQAMANMQENFSLLRSPESKLRSNNTSGAKGVHWASWKNSYCASISLFGKKYRLFFKEFDEAVEARRQMRSVRDEFVERLDSLSAIERELIRTKGSRERAEFKALFEEALDARCRR